MEIKLKCFETNVHSLFTTNKQLQCDGLEVEYPIIEPKIQIQSLPEHHHNVSNIKTHSSPETNFRLLMCLEYVYYKYSTIKKMLIVKLCKHPCIKRF